MFQGRSVRTLFTIEICSLQSAIHGQFQKLYVALDSAVFSFKMIFGVVRKEFYVASVEVPKILRKMLKCWASAEVM